MCIATLAFASARLLHPHVPFDEAANLTLGIASSHHARDKLAVLLFGIAVLFRAKRDNRKKFFYLRKYPFLDDFANLFIAGPGRVFAAVLCPRPQRELDDLVAEILRVGDARGLLDLGQFLVEKRAIEQLAGIGVLEVLIFDPGIGIIHITIEQVLTVIRIGFQVGFLDLVAAEFEIALFDFLRKLLTADRLLQRIHQMDWIGAKFSGVVIKRCGQNLECKARRDAVHAFVDAGSILVFLDAAGLRIGFLEAFTVIDPHFREQCRVFVLAKT